MIIRGIISWIIDKLPTFVIDETLWGHVLVALDWCSWANYYLPVPTLLLCAGMYITVYIARAVLKVFTFGQL